MNEKLPTIARIVLPDVDVYWSREHRGEVDVKVVNEGNNPAQAAGKAILGGRLVRLEDGINSDIRGRASDEYQAERTASASSERQNGRTTTHTGTVGIEASTEEGIIVAKAGVKGSASYEHGREYATSETSQDGQTRVYRRDHGALNTQDLAAYRLDAKYRVLDEMQDWVKDNAPSATITVGGKNFNIETKTVQAAIDERRKELAGELIETVKGGLTTTGQQILKPLIESRDLLEDSVRKTLQPFTKMFSAEPGFDNPSNPYARMYAANLDAIRTDPQLQARLGADSSPERIASAVTFAASQQNVNPETRFLFQANERGMLFAQAQGNVIDPAVARISVDTANLVLPTPAQFAQIETPAQQQATTQQNRMAMG